MVDLGDLEPRWPKEAKGRDGGDADGWPFDGPIPNSVSLSELLHYLGEEADSGFVDEVVMVEDAMAKISNHLGADELLIGTGLHRDYSAAFT